MNPLDSNGSPAKPVAERRWFYDPQLFPSPSLLQTLRMRVQEPWGANTNADGRGIVPHGFRAVFRAQKLIRTFTKCQAKLTAATSHSGKFLFEANNGLKQKCLEFASRPECIPNARCLEAVLLCRFTHDTVHEHAFTAFSRHHKTMETSLRQRAKCVRVKKLCRSRFFLWTVGQKQVVCEMGWPITFESWDTLCAAAGGLSGLVDVQLSGVHDEQSFLQFVYGNTKGAPLQQAEEYNGSSVKRTLWPWYPISKEEPVEILWSRLEAAVDAVKQVWGELGLASLLAEPLPNHWEGQRESSGAWGAASPADGVPLRTPPVPLRVRGTQRLARARQQAEHGNLGDYGMVSPRFAGKRLHVMLQGDTSVLDTALTSPCKRPRLRDSVGSAGGEEPEETAKIESGAEARAATSEGLSNVHEKCRGWQPRLTPVRRALGIGLEGDSDEEQWTWNGASRTGAK
eukprot:CAMPEP_0181324456 /NCGR_PEP_ID=MMETSP1101-20121128/20370_1 /TAXON_ID=46948 /ORGANISM="Rhodomonas abbreviata, Strain Caron Lab Isolate" /LENGTH=455 /DNA_ID=CAMNT_0023432635 /DNA_START=29 /DNA_END=1393 /DNA_ORIENTATION=+